MPELHAATLHALAGMLLATCSYQACRLTGCYTQGPSELAQRAGCRTGAGCIILAVGVVHLGHPVQGRAQVLVILAVTAVMVATLAMAAVAVCEWEGREGGRGSGTIQTGCALGRVLWEPGCGGSVQKLERGRGGDGRRRDVRSTSAACRTCLEKLSLHLHDTTHIAFTTKGPAACPASLASLPAAAHLCGRLAARGPQRGAKACESSTLFVHTA